MLNNSICIMLFSFMFGGQLASRREIIIFGEPKLKKDFKSFGRRRGRGGWGGGGGEEINKPFLYSVKQLD